MRSGFACDSTGSALRRGGCCRSRTRHARGGTCRGRAGGYHEYPVDSGQLRRPVVEPRQLSPRHAGRVVPLDGSAADARCSLRADQRPRWYRDRGTRLTASVASDDALARCSRRGHQVIRWRPALAMGPSAAAARPAPPRLHPPLALHWFGQVPGGIRRRVDCPVAHRKSLLDVVLQPRPSWRACAGLRARSRECDSRGRAFRRPSWGDPPILRVYRIQAVTCDTRRSRIGILAQNGVPCRHQVDVTSCPAPVLLKTTVWPPSAIAKFSVKVSSHCAQPEPSVIEVLPLPSEFTM